VLVAITGKGPLKQHYERRVAGLALRRIGIATLSVARAGRLNYDDRASLLNLRHRHPLARAGRLPRAARLCRPRHAAAPPPLSLREGGVSSRCSAGPGVCLHGSTSGLDLPMKAMRARLPPCLRAVYEPLRASSEPSHRCSTCSAAACPSVPSGSTPSPTSRDRLTLCWLTPPPLERTRFDCLSELVVDGTNGRPRWSRERA